MRNGPREFASGATIGPITHDVVLQPGGGVKVRVPLRGRGEGTRRLQDDVTSVRVPLRGRGEGFFCRTEDEPHAPREIGARGLSVSGVCPE